MISSSLSLPLSLSDPFLFNCHCIFLLCSYPLPGSFFQDVFPDFLSVPRNELGVSLDKWPSLKSPVIKSRLKCSGLTCCLTERHSNPDRTRETKVINTTIILLKVYMRHSTDNVDNVLSVMFILCKPAKQLLQPHHPGQSPMDNQEQKNQESFLNGGRRAVKAKAQCPHVVIQSEVLGVLYWYSHLVTFIVYIPAMLSTGIHSVTQRNISL